MQNNMERCATAVRDWFLCNVMLLNPNKSEVLLVAGGDRHGRLRGDRVWKSQAKTSHVLCKVALITHKVLATHQPQYLADIMTPYQPVRELRSSSQLKLAGRTTKKVVGTRAFSCSSTTVWNSLPQQLRAVTNLSTFKSRL